MTPGHSRRAVTLLELLIVIVIVGILATLAITSFLRPTENARNREAEANLKLVAAAEKIYRLENGEFIALNGATLINQFLRLTLPVDGQHWDYNVNSTSKSTFEATAERVSGRESGKTYMINETLDEPVMTITPP